MNDPTLDQLLGATLACVLALGSYIVIMMIPEVSDEDTQD